MELIKTIFQTAKDRLKNPLLGTFIFLWVIYNWQPLLILLFSTKKIEDKISLLKADYSSVEYWLPLIIALAYVLALPYIMCAIDWLLVKSSEIRKEFRNDSRKQDLRREIEVVNKRTELEKAKADNATQQEINVKISELELDIIQKDKRHKELRSFIQNAIPIRSGYGEVDTNKEREFDKKYEIFKTEKNFINLVRLYSIILGSVDYSGTSGTILGAFVEQDVLDNEKDEKGNIKYTLTEMGKYFLVKYLNEVID